MFLKINFRYNKNKKNIFDDQNYINILFKIPPNMISILC